METEKVRTEDRGCCKRVRGWLTIQDQAQEGGKEPGGLKSQDAQKRGQMTWGVAGDRCPRKDCLR